MALLAGCLLLANCSELQPPTAEQLGRGYILLLPGVGSGGVYLAGMIGGLGTELFGTMDRQKTASAGYIGFRDGNDQLLKCAGLQQIAWTPAWRRLGHGGDHIGYLARPWAREVLAPLLIDHADVASRTAR
ncbi:MAG: hypothetical protein HY718_20950 [Planctomycetes bacterium]|nr:hypothetical protein [Planctomycetota bacterium]